MGPKNKKNIDWNYDDNDTFLDPYSVASGTETTGLIQTPPQTEAEAESYTDLFGIPKPTKLDHND